MLCGSKSFLVILILDSLFAGCALKEKNELKEKNLYKIIVITLGY